MMRRSCIRQRSDSAPVSIRDDVVTNETTITINNNNTTNMTTPDTVRKVYHRDQSSHRFASVTVSIVAIILMVGVVDSFQIIPSVLHPFNIHKDTSSILSSTTTATYSNVYTTKTTTIDKSRTQKVSVPSVDKHHKQYNEAVQQSRNMNSDMFGYNMLLDPQNLRLRSNFNCDSLSSQQYRNHDWTSTKYAFRNEEIGSKLTSRMNRGVLGFHIGTSNEDITKNMRDNTYVDNTHDSPNNLVDAKVNKKLSSGVSGSRKSALHVTTGSKTPSNVDFASWNWPEPLSIEDEEKQQDKLDFSLDQLFKENNNNKDNHFDRVLWPMNTATFNTGNTVNIEEDVHVVSSGSLDIIDKIDEDVTTPLQWIPELDQIVSLTVIQLKDELSQRGKPKTGSKSVLQQRLIDWRIKELARMVTSSGIKSNIGNTKHPEIQNEKQDPSTTVNSLEEWVRTVNIEPLLQRRASIRKEKLSGKKFVKSSNNLPESVLTATSPLPDNCLETLTKAYEKQSPAYSNFEVIQIYNAAKVADQKGNRELSKKLLLDLKNNATPNDGRLYRRLARMEQEEGNVDSAITILQEGLQLDQNNTYLLHGLGQIYNKLGDYDNARKYYQDAIDIDPTIPNSFHALGTMEHTLGHVAQAAKILKKGIEYSPSNHRLHHAIGDVYREAKLLDMAKKSYLKAVTFSPKISQGFAFTALANTAYEQDDVSKCRSWLQKAIHENARSSNAWVAWAQLEESEGNIEVAKSVCRTGIQQYEQNLYDTKQQRPGASTHSNKNDASTFQIRSGDRFHNVYRTWARIEARYGSVSSTEDVYKRASIAFPHNWKLSLDWAIYYAEQGMNDDARTLFAKACRKSANSMQSTDAYRRYAEFEMSNNNFRAAQEILYNGVSGVLTRMKKDSIADAAGIPGLPELLYTSAVCEWYLGNHERTELLFQHVLRIIPDTNTSMRSFVLYAVAKLEIDRGEYIRAQHCIGLCLSENRNGLFGAAIWELWSDLARLMGNDRLALQCLTYAKRAVEMEQQNESNGAAIDLFALRLSAGLQEDNSSTSSDSRTQLLRRDPWHNKIFGSIEQLSAAASFPRNAFPLPQVSVLSNHDDSTVATTAECIQVE